MLEKFFAVTIFSIHKVAADENGVSIHKIESRKIGPRRKKKVYGITIMEGKFLAVAKWLQLFNPENRKGRRPERRLEKVNTLRWQGGTPQIIALFLEEDKARECFASSDLQFCDFRWQKNTKQVLKAIGNKHPTIVICRGQSKELFPKKKKSAEG